MRDRELDLLKFNYQNLHDAFWESHKVAWTAIGIFVPVMSALQGYLAKTYVRDPSADLLLIAAVISEMVTVIWRMIMFALQRFQEARRQRLKEIEEILDNIEMSNDVIGSTNTEETHLVQQYKGLPYTPEIPYIRIKMPPRRIYNIMFVLITTTNICFLRQQLGDQVFIGTLILWAVGVLAISVKQWREDYRKSKARSQAEGQTDGDST